MIRHIAFLVTMTFLLVSTMTQAKTTSLVDKESRSNLSQSIEKQAVSQISKGAINSGSDDSDHKCPCEEVKMISFLCGIPLAFGTENAFVSTFSSNVIAFELSNIVALSAHLKSLKRPPRTTL